MTALDDEETRRAALDALTYGLRALKVALRESRATLGNAALPTRRLVARIDRWREAHNRLADRTCAERRASMLARDASRCMCGCYPEEHSSETGACLLSGVDRECGCIGYRRVLPNGGAE